MLVAATEVAHLFDGSLVVDRVDNANYICLWERSTQTPIRLRTESALLSRLTGKHNVWTDLGDLLKQLLIRLLCLCRRKTCAVWSKVFFRLKKVTKGVCIFMISQQRSPQFNEVSGAVHVYSCTWIVHNMCRNSLWCDICRYGDFLSSVRNLG